jgi:hypothetical protein
MDVCVFKKTKVPLQFCPGINTREPSSPESTDSWTIPEQRRVKRGVSNPMELRLIRSDEYLEYDEDYENLVSNKIRELWYGRAASPTTTTTTTPRSASPVSTTTRKNWYPDLPIAWERML